MKRYAFWQYDRFPFVLGGEVEGRADKDGLVIIKGYNGMRLRPLCIMSAKKGEPLHNALEQLRAEYHLVLDVVGAEFQTRALEVAPFLKRLPTHTREVERAFQITQRKTRR